MNLYVGVLFASLSYHLLSKTAHMHLCVWVCLYRLSPRPLLFHLACIPLTMICQNDPKEKLYLFSIQVFGIPELISSSW